MTRSIGSLGTPHDAIDASFDYFGVVVRVNPDAGDLELMEFLMDAAEVDEVDQRKSMAAIARYLHGLIHPDDWDTFWQAAKGNRQNMADLMALGQQIVESVAGFPTGQSSPSSDGRGSTKPKSKAASSSRGGSRSRPVSRAHDVEKAIALVPDRPDLKEVFVMAEEARLAVAAA